MRRRLGIWGATDESLRLLRLLAGNADVEVTRIHDADPEAARIRARALGSALSHRVSELLVEDPAAFFAEHERELDAVVDSTGDLAEHRPADLSRAIQVVTPLTARLLWGYGVAPRDRKAELLQALHEVVESVDLTIDADDLFERMLEIAASRGLEHLWAQVDRDNSPMLGLFRDYGAVESEGEDMHTVRIDIPLTKELARKPKSFLNFRKNKKPKP